MVGTVQTQAIVTDRVDPARAQALMATLGMERPGFETGDALPPLFHRIYFWDPADPGALDSDGVRRIGGVLPELSGSTPMVSGGRITFHAPFCAGIAARRITTARDISARSGRSGPVTVVTIRHVVMQRGEAVLTEDEVHVCRADPATPSEDPGGSRPAAEVAVALRFPATQLFRHAALTFDANRLHYDGALASARHGMPGAMVPVPLIAQYLALLAENRLGRLRSFAYRAHAPLFEDQPATLCATGQDLWLDAADGRTCVTAAAGIAP